MPPCDKFDGHVSRRSRICFSTTLAKRCDFSTFLLSQLLLATVVPLYYPSDETTSDWEDTLGIILFPGLTLEG